MLHQIQSINDPWFSLLEGDPVRPNIAHQDRLGKNRHVLVLLDEHQQPRSVVCVALCNDLPSEEHELFGYQGNAPCVAVLYTIWSLSSGGGAAMIAAVKPWLVANCATLERIVTLSPLTEMARRFHLKNGAQQVRMNASTVNFEYPLD